VPEELFSLFRDMPPLIIIIIPSCKMRKRTPVGFRYHIYSENVTTPTYNFHNHLMLATLRGESIFSATLRDSKLAKAGN